MRAGEPNAPEPMLSLQGTVAGATVVIDEAARKKADDDYQKALAAYQANRKARDDAWVRLKAILAKL